jgi:Domain of unknown function (DUF4386)
LAAWGLWIILRPVNEALALLFLLLNAVGVAVQMASMLPLIAALLVGDDPDRLQASPVGEVEQLANVAVNTYITGFTTAQLFFGTWLFPLGYLVYRSGILPRALGVLLPWTGSVC